MSRTTPWISPSCGKQKRRTWGSSSKAGGSSLVGSASVASSIAPIGTNRRLNLARSLKHTSRETARPRRDLSPGPPMASSTSPLRCPEPKTTGSRAGAELRLAEWRSRTSSARSCTPSIARSPRPNERDGRRSFPPNGLGPESRIDRRERIFLVRKRDFAARLGVHVVLGPEQTENQANTHQPNRHDRRGWTAQPRRQDPCGGGSRIGRHRPTLGSRISRKPRSGSRPLHREDGGGTRIIVSPWYLFEVEERRPARDVALPWARARIRSARPRPRPRRSLPLRTPRSPTPTRRRTAKAQSRQVRVDPIR